MSDVDSNEIGSLNSWTFEQEKAQLDGEAQSILVEENSPLLSLKSFTDQDDIHQISCPGPSPPSEAHDGTSDFDELIDHDFSSIESVGRDDTSDFVELSSEDDDSVSVQSTTDGSEHEEVSGSPDGEFVASDLPQFHLNKNQTDDICFYTVLAPQFRKNSAENRGFRIGHHTAN